MHNANLPEYEEISRQIAACSSEVIRQAGLVLSLSSIAFGYVTQFRPFATEQGSLEISLTIPILLFGISIITLTLLMIINYKASSHNRLSAYRQLISSEDYCDIRDNPLAIGAILGERRIAAFDYCVGELNLAFKNRTVRLPDGFWTQKLVARKGVLSKLVDGDLDKFIAQAFPRGMSLEGIPSELTLTEFADDKVRPSWQVPWVTCELLFRKVSPGTWRLPHLVNKLLIVMALTEATCGGYYTISTLTEYNSSTILSFEFSTIGQEIFLALLIIVFCAAYARCIRDWQQLNHGLRRVFIYFVQLIPYRVAYLQSFFSGQVHPFYHGRPFELELRSIDYGRPQLK